MSNALATDYNNSIGGGTMPKVYTVIIRPCTDTSGYYAVCDTPNGGCVTQGETLQDTQKSMIEAMGFHLEHSNEAHNYFLSFEVKYATNTDY